jgi:mannose-6-phosphate isomerase-like protein (cupin superfamily)
MTEQQMPPTPAVVVGPDDGRELPMIGRVAVSAAQTGGAFELIEFRGNAACPPPHIHREREECIQVLEGLFTFTIDTDEIEVAPCSWVYVSRERDTASPPAPTPGG